MMTIAIRIPLILNLSLPIIIGKLNKGFNYDDKYPAESQHEIRLAAIQTNQTIKLSWMSDQRK